MRDILCLVGPTGAGKTAAALHIAQTFTGGVINADSRQVYRDVPIITAQPNAEEKHACSHTLYGFLAMEERISAGIWAEKACAKIATFADNQVLPMLVGGTGMYVKSLVQGIVAIPPIPTSVHEDVQLACAQQGTVALHEELSRIDSAYALKIHPHDTQRITRALEVFYHTGKPFSLWHEETKPCCPVRPLSIGFDMTLEALQPRLALRIEQMLAAGALEEAKKAKAICNNSKAPGWSGIGCAELFAYLEGHISLDEACSQWLRNTRAYAKRQLTWFRADKSIHWFAPDDIEGMTRCVRSFLQKKEM